MGETRIIDPPPSHFGNFLEHMANTGHPEWTWSFIEMCARFGVFHSSEKGTILARPVDSKMSENDLLAFNDLDPNSKLASTGLTNSHDTWHILYASGDLSFFFDLCPYDLEHLSWHRKGGNSKLKLYKFKTVKKRTYGK